MPKVCLIYSRRSTRAWATRRNSFLLVHDALHRNTALHMGHWDQAPFYRQVAHGLHMAFWRMF